MDVHLVALVVAHLVPVALGLVREHALDLVQGALDVVVVVAVMVAAQVVQVAGLDALQPVPVDV